MSDLHLVWSTSGKILKGLDPASGWKDTGFSFGPLFAGVTTPWTQLFLTSSSTYDKSDHVLGNIRFVLEAEDVVLVRLADLARQGHGVQISFTDGRNFESLGLTPVPLPPGCISGDSNSTELRPFDTARVHLRVSVPPGYQELGKFPFRVAALFEAI